MTELFSLVLSIHSDSPTRAIVVGIPQQRVYQYYQISQRAQKCAKLRERNFRGVWSGARISKRDAADAGMNDINDNEIPFSEPLGTCAIHKTSLILYEGSQVCKTCLAKRYGIRL